MANYHHILLATDFSKEVDTVLERALELKEQHGAELSLIHVVEYTGSMYAGEIPLPDDLDLDQRISDQAERQLKELADLHGIPSHACHVEIGVPKHEITRIAKETDTDLIIIGSHGRHGLQLLLGSTANGVLHLAHCDVLAVRVGQR